MMDKILVADDDLNICELLRLYLEKEGFEVVMAHDGEEAVAKFESEKPSLILLDIMMPKLDGLSVLRTLRERGSQIPVLLRNPRQLIPSERFLEKIWGYDSDVELNVVWVYISYLRKKLTALQADIQIKATRNAGYSLEKKP